MKPSIASRCDDVCETPVPRSEQIYRQDIVRHIVYTDGAQHVAEADEANWLLDKIACALLEPHIAREKF